MKSRRHHIIFISLVFTLLFFALIDLLLGSVSIPLRSSFQILFGHEENKNWEYILLQMRFPRAITAILTGAGLSVAGLMMQTLFRNPLAGPYVLGISSGASLGVALVVMSASFLPAGIMFAVTSYWGQIIAAIVGATLVFMLIVMVASHVRDSVSLLIVGIMFGSLTTAVVSILQYFSRPELVQKFVIWTLGSLSSTDWGQLQIIAIFVLTGIGLAIFLIKPLNALLLGENNARTTGVNVRRIRYLVLLSASVIAGALTAFTGPIAFIGLAVPHLCRLLFGTSNHRILIPASLIVGALVLVQCDIISQMPGFNIVLPINAITSLFGAPMVLWIIIGKRKLRTSF
jgi:iron complex transport system permease protein